jgi:predicted Fe-S protein YdhL (DUF1289 family)
MADPKDVDLSQFEPEDSPCQQICSMDKESGHCFGCGRTSDEIAYWTTKSKAERAAILDALDSRMPPLREKLAQRRAKRRVNRRSAPRKTE